MRSTRLRSSYATIVPILLLVAALVFWPTVDSVRHQTISAQGVEWLSNDSAGYLASSGIPVMVPSWLPGPVGGTSPEIYAGDGSYSIYFYAGSSFLYITGTAGAGFPGGSEANLNMPLEINTSVQGYPAIQDIGIPEGSETPIYDKVMWIAGGVLYTVSGNGLDSGSLGLANSSVQVTAPQEPAPPQTSPDKPASGGSGNVSDQPAGAGSQAQSDQPTNTGSQGQSSKSTTNQPSTSSSSSSSNLGDTVSETTVSGPSNDGTTGPWFTGHGVSDLPSDGTAGAIPPFLGDDGTGGVP